MRVGLWLGNNQPEMGGGYTFESEILQSLVKNCAGSKHTFILLSWQKEQPQEISGSHIQFVSLLQRGRRERVRDKTIQIANRVLEKLPYFKIRRKIQNWIEEIIIQNKIDIIWCLTPTYPPTVELPYITVVWDLQHRLQPYFPEVSIEGRWHEREQAYALMLRRATVVTTGCEASKAEIEHFYQVPSENIKTLPLPTPSFALNAPADSGEQVLTKYNIPQNYLFYPAQFWPHKNHVGLLLAVQLLRDKYDIIFPVVFVGSDKGNQQYIKLIVAELDLMSQVYFLGFVPQQDLVALYRHAFALTFLSFFGPDNLPPLEAFALYCPVVAANVSGAKEQLGDAALLVDPKEPEQIAKAIKLLYDERSLHQNLIHKGIERASKWTGQDYVKAIFSILDEFEPIRRCWSSKEPYQNL